MNRRAMLLLLSLSAVVLGVAACEQDIMVDGGCCVIWSEVRVEVEGDDGSPLRGAEVTLQPYVQSSPTGLTALQLETDEQGLTSHQWSEEYFQFERLGIFVQAPAGIDAPPVGDTIDMTWATRAKELPVTTLRFVLQLTP